MIDVKTITEIRSLEKHELLYRFTWVVILSAFLPEFVAFVFKCFFEKSKEQCELEKKLEDLDREMDRISMVDEFAKHAKMQRQRNKFLADLKEEKKSSQQMLITINYIMRIFVNVITSVLQCIMLFSYWHEPLVALDPLWTFPFHRVVSYPTDQIGAISIIIWSLAIKETVSRFRRFLFH